MSREELSNFVNAAEHSLYIKRDLSRIKNSEEIISIAQKYGFKINNIDLEEADFLDSKNDWFSKSKISSIKSIN